MASVTVKGFLLLTGPSGPSARSTGVYQQGVFAPPPEPATSSLFVRSGGLHIPETARKAAIIGSDSCLHASFIFHVT